MPLQSRLMSRSAVSPGTALRWAVSSTRCSDEHNIDGAEQRCCPPSKLATCSPRTHSRSGRMCSRKSFSARVGGHLRGDHTQRPSGFLRVIRLPRAVRRTLSRSERGAGVFRAARRLPPPRRLLCAFHLDPEPRARLGELGGFPRDAADAASSAAATSSRFVRLQRGDARLTSFASRAFSPARARAPASRNPWLHAPRRTPSATGLAVPPRRPLDVRGAVEEFLVRLRPSACADSAARTAPEPLADRLDRRVGPVGALLGRALRGLRLLGLGGRTRLRAAPRPGPCGGGAAVAGARGAPRRRRRGLLRVDGHRRRGGDFVHQRVHLVLNLRLLRLGVLRLPRVGFRVFLRDDRPPPAGLLRCRRDGRRRVDRGLLRGLLRGRDLGRLGLRGSPLEHSLDRGLLRGLLRGRDLATATRSARPSRGARSGVFSAISFSCACSSTRSCWRAATRSCCASRHAVVVVRRRRAGFALRGGAERGAAPRTSPSKRADAGIAPPANKPRNKTAAVAPERHTAGDPPRVARRRAISLVCAFATSPSHPARIARVAGCGEARGGGVTSTWSQIRGVQPPFS